jgi:pimeloyl-ACP methyl ester carboxylesterase
MRAHDIEAIGDLLAEALDAGGLLVQDTHEAIARRSFAAVGPMGRPVQVIHDGIAGAVYRGVRGALRTAAKHGGAAWARSVPADAPALTSSAGGSIAAGAVNGIWGDLLAVRGSSLAFDMTLRSQGVDVATTAEALAGAFPNATSRLAIFVHGLCETDEAWKGLPSRRDAEPRVPFGTRLHDDLGYTELQVRFNSGLHISDNGRRLAALIDEVTQHWPEPVDEIVLVGHSMGGLVARSACHYALEDALPWTADVRHVFCLGTPHLGADLEKGVHLLGWALGLAPETRAFAGALKSRSAGVKDLRFGSCAEEDWRDQDPDEFFKDRCGDVPFLPDAHYYFVGATLAPAPVGHLLGDLLVRAPSASGQGRARRIPFEVDNGAQLPGLSHFDLLNHPAVYDQLRLWLTRDPAALTAAAEPLEKPGLRIGPRAPGL